MSATEISGLRSNSHEAWISLCRQLGGEKMSVCTDPGTTRQWDKEERALRWERGYPGAVPSSALTCYPDSNTGALLPMFVLINEAGEWCGRPRPLWESEPRTQRGPDFQSPWEHFRSRVSPMGLSQWRPWSHFAGHSFSAAAMMSGPVLKPYPGMTQLRAGAICLCYQSQLFCASKGKYRQLLIPQNTYYSLKQSCQQIVSDSCFLFLFSSFFFFNDISLTCYFPILCLYMEMNLETWSLTSIFSVLTWLMRFSCGLG